MADERLETLGRRVMEKRAEYAAAHKKKVKAEEAKVKAERELHEALEKSKQKSTTLELGEPWGTMEFGRRRKTLSSVFDVAAFEEWCKANNCVMAYLAPSPRKAPINQMVKEYDETGQELPPGVEPRITKYVQATKR